MKYSDMHILLQLTFDCLFNFNIGPYEIYPDECLDLDCGAGGATFLGL